MVALSSRPPAAFQPSKTPLLPLPSAHLPPPTTLAPPTLVMVTTVFPFPSQSSAVILTARSPMSTLVVLSRGPLLPATTTQPMGMDCGLMKPEELAALAPCQLAVAGQPLSQPAR